MFNPGPQEWTTDPNPAFTARVDSMEPSSAASVKSDDRLGGSYGILVPKAPAAPTISERESSSRSHLEQVTREIVECINNREWSPTPWIRHISEDFEVCLDHLGKPSIFGKDKFLNCWQKYTEANPDYHCEILNLTVTVREKTGTATVWLSMRITGDPPNTQRENVTLTYWRRCDDMWLACKQTGYRGACFS